MIVSKGKWDILCVMGFDDDYIFDLCSLEFEDKFCVVIGG